MNARGAGSAEACILSTRLVFLSANSAGASWVTEAGIKMQIKCINQAPSPSSTRSIFKNNLKVNADTSENHNLIPLASPPSLLLGTSLFFVKYLKKKKIYKTKFYRRDSDVTCPIRDESRILTLTDGHIHLSAFALHPF